MKKRPKRKPPSGRTAKASSRIFYRHPLILLGEFFWSGAGLTAVPLMAFAGILFASHIAFIRTCG